MGYEVELKTGLSAGKLDALIVKLERIATLSDEVSKKRISPGVSGVKFPKATGVGTDTTLTAALKHLDSSVVKLTATISKGVGRGAVRGAAAAGTSTKAADLQLLSLNQQIKSARKAASVRILEAKRASEGEARELRKLDNLRLLKLNNDIKSARKATEARAREARKAAQAEIKEAKKASAERVKAAERAAKAESKHGGAKQHKAAVVAAGALRAALYASGVGIGLFTAQTVLAAGSAYFLVKAMRAVVSTGADFTEAMARTNAIMGANAEMSKRNAVEVRKLAKETVFTATQTAEGLTFLAMAGLKGDEAIQALPGTLNLASIGMIDMAQSADMATNVMNEFGKTSSDLDDIVNSMALSVTSSNTTIQQLGSALSYVGPIAHATNTTLNETIAMISTMADSGIKGTRAGTALRRSISNLLSPSKKVAKELDTLSVSVRNNYGEMRSMVDIMKDLAEVTDDVGVLTRLFGVRAAPGMIAVWVDMKKGVKGLIPELVKLKKAMDKVKGTKFAEEMRRDVEDHLKGDWLKALAAAEEAALKLFEVFEEPLRDATKSMATFLNENSDDWARWAENVRAEVGAASRDLQKVLAVMKLFSIPTIVSTLTPGAALTTPKTEQDKELNKNREFLKLYATDISKFNRRLKYMGEERVKTLSNLLKSQLEAEKSAALTTRKGRITRGGEKETDPKIEELQRTLDAVQTRAAKLELEKALKSDKYKTDKFKEAITKFNKERIALRKEDLDDSLAAINKELGYAQNALDHSVAMEQIKYGKMAEVRRSGLHKAQADADKLIGIEISAQKAIAAEKLKAVEDIKRKPAEARDVGLLTTREENYQKELKELIKLEKLRHDTKQEYAAVDRANWREEKLHYKTVVDKAKEAAVSIGELVEAEQSSNAQIVKQIESYRTTGKALEKDADLKLKAEIATKSLEITTLKLALAQLRVAGATNEAIAAMMNYIEEAQAGLNRLDDTLADRKGLREQLKKYNEMEKMGSKAANALKSSFADFLFNPFDKGLKGMVESFAVALQRMLSDAVASEIMDAIFKPTGKGGNEGTAVGFFTNIFSTWFGGASAGKALGGPVHAGSFYPVNEKEPEIFSTGGKDYLMTGSKNGTVSQDKGRNGGGDVYNFHFPNVRDSREMRQSAGQAGSAFAQAVAVGRRNQ